MRVNESAQLWEFDVDDTLVMWDRSKYPELEDVAVLTDKGTAVLKVNKFQVKLLIKLAKVGYFIRVHSGSGFDWASKVVQALGIEQYVDEVASKPKGRTDDKAPGDGYAYHAYRDPVTGKESN